MDYGHPLLTGSLPTTLSLELSEKAWNSAPVSGFRGAGRVSPGCCLEVLCLKPPTGRLENVPRFHAVTYHIRKDSHLLQQLDNMHEAQPWCRFQGTDCRLFLILAGELYDLSFSVLLVCVCVLSLVLENCVTARFAISRFWLPERGAQNMRVDIAGRGLHCKVQTPELMLDIILASHGACSHHGPKDWTTGAGRPGEYKKIVQGTTALCMYIYICIYIYI